MATQTPNTKADAREAVDKILAEAFSEKAISLEIDSSGEHALDAAGVPVEKCRLSIEWLAPLAGATDDRKSTLSDAIAAGIAHAESAFQEARVSAPPPDSSSDDRVRDFLVPPKVQAELMRLARAAVEEFAERHSLAKVFAADETAHATKCGRIVAAFIEALPKNLTHDQITTIVVAMIAADALEE